jgi:ATP-dependent helicase YprA (DUF1998 family)
MIRADESYLWRLIVEYHSIGSIAGKCQEQKSVNTHRERLLLHTSKPVCQSLNLLNRETEYIKSLSNGAYWSRRVIAPSLLADDYRLHLTIQLSEVNLSCTLHAINVNQTATYIDHLLLQDKNKASNNKNGKQSAVSSRLVLVRVNYCKVVGKNIPGRKQNSSDNLHTKERTEVSDPCTTLAQNGFDYLGHRYRYLLSKDPRDKVAYFLRDDVSSRTFPDAQSVRNFIADFTAQPTIFRAGKYRKSLR